MTEEQIRVQLDNTVQRLIAKALEIDGSKLVSTALAILRDNGIRPDQV